MYDSVDAVSKVTFILWSEYIDNVASQRSTLPRRYLTSLIQTSDFMAASAVQ